MVLENQRHMTEIKGDDLSSMKPPSSIKSKSNMLEEQAIESTFTRNVSNMVFDGNSKCSEAGIQLSDGNTSTSVKSEICSEVRLPLINAGNFEMNIAKNRSNGAEDESQQNRTESSCSNTLSVIPQLSLSNRSCQETEKGAIHEILNHSNYSENLNCPSKSKSEENIRSCDEHDTQTTSLSAERMISSEISVEDKTKSEYSGNKSCEDDSKKIVACFDLNEDINADGTDDIINPVAQTTSSNNVIHVVAKSAMPKGLPMKPLKFEGGLNWKGSAETSAFRPANFNSSRNYGSKDPQNCTGFDLNIMAGEDSDSPSQISPKRTEGLGFDLNCLYEAADEFPKPSIHESRNLPLMDLNLNGSKNSDSENPRKRDFIFTSEPYVSDFSYVQHAMTKPHDQQFFVQPLETTQRVVSFQPNLPFMPHVLPPQSYPFKNPFHFNCRDSLPYSIDYSRAMPYPEHYREHGVFAELMNPSMVRSSNGPTYFVPKVDVKREECLSRSGGKMDETRQFVFLANATPTEEPTKCLQQEAWFATSAKRKEPEEEWNITNLATNRSFDEL